MHGLLNQPLVGEPGACPFMELDDVSRRGTTSQPLLHHICEQMMIAIPAALVVQRYEKTMESLQIGKNDLAVGTVVDSCGGSVDRETKDVVAEGCAEALQDRRGQHEGLDMGRKLRNDLVDQVINHKPIAAADGGDKVRGTR